LIDFKVKIVTQFKDEISYRIKMAFIVFKVGFEFQRDLKMSPISCKSSSISPEFSKTARFVKFESGKIRTNSDTIFTYFSLKMSLFDETTNKRKLENITNPISNPMLVFLPAFLLVFEF
jgi:hypothetical protein